MAAIGSIRKHGVLLMIIIGFALILFLLTGLFDNNTLFRIFSSEKFTRAKIDGETVDEEYIALNSQLTSLFRMYQLLEERPATMGEAETFQIHEATWQQLIYEKAMDKEFKGLGINFNEEMVENIMSEARLSLGTAQPNNYFGALFQFLAVQFGAENAQSILSSIDELRDNPNLAEIYSIYQAVERSILFDYKMRVYMSMAQGTVYFSDALAQKCAEDNQTLTAGLVSLHSTAPGFSDLVVDVSDKEMKNWYKMHKNRYEVNENVRDIDIAIFPIAPTPEDRLHIEDSVKNLYGRFAASHEMDSFNRAGSFGLVDSSYHKRGDNLVINSRNNYLYFNNIEKIDSLIFDRPVGSHIEPFTYEESIWFFGKSFGVAYRPDSIQVAFLVVDFRNSQNPQGTRTKSQARREADSLINVLQSGSTSLFSLLPDYLAGRTATDSTVWFEDNKFQGIVTQKLYNDLVKLPNGAFYKDEIPFAFLVYQVLDRTQPVEKRQYALYAFDIEASENTISSLRAQAGQLAAASSSASELLDQANSQGIQVIQAPNVTSMVASVPQLRNARSIVSWAFSENVGKDAVSDVFKLDDGVFAVATVKNIRNQGTPKFEEVKDQISTELTAMKKVEMMQAAVQNEIASGSSMAQVASKYNVNVIDSARLSFIGETYQNMGVENGAVGKIFALADNRQPQVVAGKNGVYLFTVSNGPQQQSSPTGDYQMEKNFLRNVCVGRNRNEFLVLEGVKNQMDIWDNRSRFFPN